MTFRFGCACGLVLASFAAIGCSSDDAPADKTPTSPPTVRIVKPAPGQVFAPSDVIPLEGSGVDSVEGDIGKLADRDTRMIWKGGFEGREVNPAGEGPADDLQPLMQTGTFVIRFEVTNKAGQTGSAQITIAIR
jgi:hypothetical protein